MSAHWFRGDHCKFYPDQEQLKQSSGIENFVLDGLLPQGPFISKQHSIMAIGSCFARHILVYLRDHGYHIAGNEDPETAIGVQAAGLINVFAILQQFEWAYGLKEINQTTWFMEHNKYLDPTPEVQLKTKSLFDSTDVFILTWGLSEIWYHKDTGEAFWNSVPAHQYDASKHGFRVASTQETIEAMNKTLSIIRQYHPDAPIILTVSPIPLRATFRPISCVVANSVSKAILRASLDEVLRQRKDTHIYYWPSYEIITSIGLQAYDADNRHVMQETINMIMNLFAKYYLI